MPNFINCPICTGTNTELFLKRESVPANQNLLVSSEEKAKSVPKGVLSLQRCRSCGFVFNQTFDLSLIHYGDSYDNTQHRSEAFQRHLEMLVNALVVEKGIQNSQIIEVGCGKGHFLESLITHPLSQNRGIGFDSSYEGLLSRYDGKLRFEKRFYDESSSHLPADAIICRHVIEHISQPVEFLKTIKKTLAKSPHARLFFETPCLEWILKNRAMWDFFYEHCSYYTKDSLSLAFENAGFQINQVGHAFEGQYLWLEASIGTQKRGSYSLFEPLKQMDEYLCSEKKFIKSLTELIEKLLKKGRLAIWGAGAKGVTFANLFDPKRKFFDCVIDVNPRKQNHFIPGTGHPILGIDALKEREIKNIILMNPNYSKENKELLKKNQITTKIVSIHE